MDKPFPINPRAITGPPKMSLLLEASRMPALIIKPKLILVTHIDDLGWNITSNQQQQMLIQDLNRMVSRPNITPGQILYCTTNCIPIDLMFKEHFPPRGALSKLLKREGRAGAEGAILPYVGHLQLISTLKIGADCCQLCQYKLTKRN